MVSDIYPFRVILQHALGSRSAVSHCHLPRHPEYFMFRVTLAIHPADRRRGSQCRSGDLSSMYKNAQGGGEWHTTARSCATALLVVLSALQSQPRYQLGRLLTSGAGGVLLDGAALADKGVLAGLGGRAGKAALDDGRAEPGGEARRAAEELALREHGEEWVVRSWAGFGCGCGRASMGWWASSMAKLRCQCANVDRETGVRSAIRSFPALLRDGELSVNGGRAVGG